MVTGRDLGEAMADVAATIEAELESLLPANAGAGARLQEAMRYAVLNGGKRLRPFLTYEASRLFDAPPAAAVRVGAAIELVHAYSLVHDDLPAMDDAKLRRGKPACHRAFDEATAMLAGDALQALAFEALARQDWPASAEQRVSLVCKLASAAGAAGMCGGQQVDLESERKALDLAEITHLQRLKTGAMISFSLEAGAILGNAGVSDREALLAYGANLGLAFQIKDDLLDLDGDATLVGKDLGRDLVQEKATFPALLGVDGARAELVRLRDKGCARLDRFGEPNKVLRDLFDYVINREL